MPESLRPIVLHTLEALVVLGFSVLIAHLFPQHASVAGATAFTALTGLAKWFRFADASPVNDYVNGAGGEQKTNPDNQE